MSYFKTCNLCKLDLNLSLFGNNKRNKDGKSTYCKTCHNKKQKEWIIKNYKKHRENQREWHTENQRNRINTDTSFKLKHYLRNRLGCALKNNQKTGSAIEDLGCSIKYFKNYIESKFNTGMTWDNYGEWHIDHIKPLSSFNLNDKVEFKKAAHYSNMQPLWAMDNLKKSNKLRKVK